MPSSTLGREKQVEFAGKSYTVRKMPLGQYAKFSEKLEELLPNKQAMTVLIGGSPADRIETVLSLFKTAPLRLAELVHIGSGIPVELISDALPEDVLDLLEELYALNEFDRLGARVKKALGLGTAK